MSDTAADQLARETARVFRRYMLDEYVPRIAHCVGMLSEEEIWARPNAHSNSVGNLLRHLEGNVRQWILAGVDGRPDERDRDAEFAATGETETASPAELVERLRATVTEAVDVVEGLGPDGLLARGLYQSRYEDSALGAVLHVMEHFSGHAGQIYAFTKQAKDVDLAFYDL